ncbi:DNA polymerase III subunit chi [Defluviimonas sp. WL0075]|uniref:DNA polymerase III subunit chi n=1 Tax=Albidovulum sediminicola TaxID=2984331 RepID=A0ABT2YZP0_9RHOB|nr:DNA polymerase III subunit chi [Defluviimonas sp. WL0075]MCV2864290.1 DNA polymerase III subunit chi [Defluviimonas sp. WL0075]
MGEAFFYHLTRSPLEGALPTLLARALQNGWHVVVRGADAGRLDWLDQHLWLGPEESFLPHGLAGGVHDAAQPVLLTTGPEVPNGAQCLMTIDGAPFEPEEALALTRVCVIFDGNDQAALDTARGQWRQMIAAGVPAQYWSEESGRWQKKAESGARPA